MCCKPADVTSTDLRIPHLAYPLRWYPNAAPRPHRGLDRASDRERACLNCVCRQVSPPPVPSRAGPVSGGREDFGVLVFGERETKRNGRRVRAAGPGCLTSADHERREALRHIPPPRHLRLRRKVRARAADGAEDPVRPACRPAADSGPTGCGAGSTHVHRAIDARTGGGRRRRRAAHRSPFHVRSNIIDKVRTLCADSGVW